MRTNILVLGVLCGMVFGCSKADQATKPSAEMITLNEADVLLAQPAETENGQVSQADIVINDEAGSLADGVVSDPSMEAPEEVPDTPDEKMIQQALKNEGLYAGAIDGDIGKKTKEAIREFQRKNGLSPDGKVGPKTWSVLRRSLEQVPAEVSAAAEGR